ncbi:uncharacterized protein LOC143025860 [Oratosquilla oratoria]|uniref:uncharacterized protein LOC143025860 n=1 Tax=Oratosquilla oratoria TaxID=337810 RepID=UPI003F764593
MGTSGTSYSMWTLLLVGVVLPLTSSFITYTFVSMENNAIMLDQTQALIAIIALIKLALLGSTGVFPIDLNQLYRDLAGNRIRRQALRFPLQQSLPTTQVAELYQIPEDDWLPCVRRFLCELEVAAKTSDQYEVAEPQIDPDDEDRHPEEDVAPPKVDPMQEMHIEALRALYRETDPSGELSTRSSRALRSLEALTGKSCEAAYRNCPGRFTPSGAFNAVFEEINLGVHEEL